MKIMVRYFLHVLIVVISLGTARMQAAAPMAHYWVDDDKIVESTAPLDGNRLSLDIDVSDYPGGHTLYYRIQDEDGSWSAVKCVPFASHSHRGGDARSYVYWFDKDYDRKQNITVPENSIVFNAECENIAPGAHCLYYRVDDQFGNFGSPVCHVFYKKPATSEGITWYRYWWNDRYDLATEVPVDAEGGVFMLDTELRLPEYAVDTDADIHRATLNIMFGDEEGNISEILVAEVDYEPYILSVVDVEAGASWNYHSKGNELTLTGLTPGKGLVRIYTLDGQLLFSNVPQAENLTHTIEKTPIVIVCYDGVSRKVLLR